MRAHAKSSLVAAGVLLALAAGCSAAPGSADDVASESSAITKPGNIDVPNNTNCGIKACAGSEGDPTPAPDPACSLSGFTPPSTAGTAAFTCAGPWSYEDYNAPCYAQKSDGSICGYHSVAYSCPTYNSCRNPAFGVETTQSYSTSQPVTGVYHRGFKDPDTGIITQPYWDYSTPCHDAGQAFFDSYVAWAGGPGPNEWFSATLGSAVQGAKDQKWCVIQTSALTLYNFKQDPICGVSSWGTCFFPMANTCRAAPFGFDPDHGACGATGTKYSASGQSRGGLSSADANLVSNDSRWANPACSTCEDLPVDTADHVKAKHDCLIASLNTFKSTSDTATITRLVHDVKLLLEVDVADKKQLDSARQQQALQLYLDQPSIRDTCNITWPGIADDKSCDAKERADVDAALSLCGEISKSGITPDARAPFVDYCVDNVRGMPGLLDCNGYYDAYTKIMTDLEVAMQNGLLPGNTRDQGLLSKVQGVLAK